MGRRGKGESERALAPLLPFFFNCLQSQTVLFGFILLNRCIDRSFVRVHFFSFCSLGAEDSNQHPNHTHTHCNYSSPVCADSETTWRNLKGASRNIKNTKKENFIHYRFFDDGRWGTSRSTTAVKNYFFFSKNVHVCCDSPTHPPLGLLRVTNPDS